MTFDLPADSAEKSLKRFSEQAGREVLFASHITRGVRANPVKGEWAPREAIERLLANTGLVAVPDSKTGAFSVRMETSEEGKNRKRTAPATAGDPSRDFEKKKQTETARAQEPMKRNNLMTKLTAVIALIIGSPASAQTIATGTIEGRVFDSGRGEFLENARVTIEGTSQEKLTEAGGLYRFTQVPAGIVKVKVFFTGLPTQTNPVTVAGGETVQHNVTLSAAGSPSAPKPGAAPGDTVQLERFVVSTSKEMDGAAIAINTQRFARSIMNVVAADEFGMIVDGTPGEAMKFLPGITLEYSAGEARSISLNGVPSANVPVTVGGFELASTVGNGNNRGVPLDQFSINSIARIEVIHSPTPETTGSALAGSVNMVPRSAFERSRPFYTASAFFTMKDAERSLRKTPGPFNKATHKITPGFNFNAIVPLNKKFGFTLSGNHVDFYSFEDVANSVWRGAGAVSNPAQFLPDTPPDKPYMSDFILRDSTRGNVTDSVALTVDYKPTPNDTLSFSFQYTYIVALHNDRRYTFFLRGFTAGAFGPTFTRGTGAASALQINGLATDWRGTTMMPTLTWKHNGPVWKAEAGAGYSRATLHTRNAGKGFFGPSQALRTGLNITFEDIFYLRPNKITVTDAAGRPFDPYDINNFPLNTASDVNRDSSDLKRSVNGSLARDFEVRGVPLTLKGGFDVRSAERDLRRTDQAFNFVGADRIPSLLQVGDDSAAVVFDEAFSQRNGPYGFPKLPHLDNHEYYALYKAHPEYFTTDANAFYRSGPNQSKYTQEIISSLYLRGDLAFFNRRLLLVGGLRAEQTNVKAAGPLADPTGNFRRDASGNFVPRRDAAGNILRDAQGRPLPELIVPATDALGVSRLTLLDRGQHTRKEYLRLFPNLNASFNLRENLIARGAYYQSVGRPTFNQYSGGLTLPDTSNPAANAAISVNNAGIKAWQAETFKVRLEYYFERVGQISLGAFRREIKDFFGSVRFPATPEFLALYGLDPAEFGTYEVATNYNLNSSVRMTGLEFDYRQALTFLPEWARGVQVFFNASTIRTIGDGAANFAGFVPRSGSWGWSLTRPKYILRMNWNYRGKARDSLIAPNIRSIGPATYNWESKRLYLDVTAEYNLRRNLTLFANIRNINDEPQDTKVYGPDTPDYAKFRQRIDYGAFWTFGLRGSF